MRKQSFSPFVFGHAICWVVSSAGFCPDNTTKVDLGTEYSPSFTLFLFFVSDPGAFVSYATLFSLFFFCLFFSGEHFDCDELRILLEYFGRSSFFGKFFFFTLGTHPPVAPTSFSPLSPSPPLLFRA